MREFGWTIEYTLSLSFPIFMDLFELIRRVRYDAAIDGVFTPYCAAKFGGKCAKALFDGRGSIILGATESTTSGHEKITKAMIKKANEKLKRIIAEREAAMAAAASGNLDKTC